MSFINGKILFLLLAGVLAVASVIWLQPATAKLNAKKGQPNPPPTVFALVRLQEKDPILLEPNKQTRNRSDKEEEALRRDEITFVKSRSILTAAIQPKNVRVLQILLNKQNPEEWLRNILEVDFPNKGKIIRIGMSGSNTEEMAILVNSVLDTYVQKKKEIAKLELADQFSNLERATFTLEEKLRLLRGDLRKLSETLKLPSLLDQQVLRQSLQECSGELRRVQLKRVALQVQLAEKPAEKEEGKEPKTGSRRLLEEQLAILAEQEKYLAKEENDLQAKTNKGLVGLDFEIRQVEIDISHQTLRRLFELRECLEIERSNSSESVRILQNAEASNPK